MGFRGTVAGVFGDQSSIYKAVNNILDHKMWKKPREFINGDGIQKVAKKISKASAAVEDAVPFFAKARPMWADQKMTKALGYDDNIPHKGVVEAVYTDMVRQAEKLSKGSTIIELPGKGTASFGSNFTYKMNPQVGLQQNAQTAAEILKSAGKATDEIDKFFDGSFFDSNNTIAMAEKYFGRKAGSGIGPTNALKGYYLNPMGGMERMVLHGGAAATAGIIGGAIASGNHKDD